MMGVASPAKRGSDSVNNCRGVHAGDDCCRHRHEPELHITRFQGGEEVE